MILVNAGSLSNYMTTEHCKCPSTITRQNLGVEKWLRHYKQNVIVRPGQMSTSGDTAFPMIGKQENFTHLLTKRKGVTVDKKMPDQDIPANQGR